jgi:hypothetical protein
LLISVPWLTDRRAWLRSERKRSTNRTQMRPSMIALALPPASDAARLHGSSRGRRRYVLVTGIVHVRNACVAAVPTASRAALPRTRLRECAADKRFQDDSGFSTVNDSITASYVE